MTLSHGHNSNSFWIAEIGLAGLETSLGRFPHGESSLEHYFLNSDSKFDIQHICIFDNLNKRNTMVKFIMQSDEIHKTGLASF